MVPEPEESSPVVFRFVAGTLEVRGLAESFSALLPADCRWDPRTRCFRAPALAYAPIVLALRREGVPYRDEARAYGVLEEGLQVRRVPRPFQEEAVEAWWRAGGRGVIVLPTGAGKSYAALMAIDRARRDTLVVAPTLDLVAQWYELLETGFRREVGVLGGGEHRVCPITVSTYDSAHLHMEHLGARFGLIVFDECHHLPGETYSFAALASLAPFRLGLTATPERADGRHESLNHLIGPVVYRREVDELAGEYLADYIVEEVLVELTPEERAEYEAAWRTYRAFVDRYGIVMNSPKGWSQFVRLSSLSEEGRRAMKAYQRQRELAFAAPSKLDYVEYLLRRHRRDRVLLFTERNASAYELSRRFLIPAITHQTPPSERVEILRAFGEGEVNILATSKVLNEGVDLPEANVGIVLSGSGSVREHVQRLGRLLRRREGKQAVLYELIASETSEVFVSLRRRKHRAYR
ncbi:MAG: helicase [Candidatus Poribacteria bacterium]|nr:MAG: helicase [Candidatus Poribacteria bacterium]